MNRASETATRQRIPVPGNAYSTLAGCRKPHENTHAPETHNCRSTAIKERPRRHQNQNTNTEYQNAVMHAAHWPATSTSARQRTKQTALRWTTSEYQSAVNKTHAETNSNRERKRDRERENKREREREREREIKFVKYPLSLSDEEWRQALCDSSHPGNEAYMQRQTVRERERESNENSIKYHFS